MALTPGARLGPYDIVAQIGEGGMGQVYRAHDTRLNRDVALKVLPDAFANDSDRLTRFTREAQTLASLNHPHIAAIYGVEDGPAEAGPHVRALVMELVEGEDLSQRIARGAIPLDEALPIAKQIAEALEAAHEQGIIHRDLKPANIKVTQDGVVKVLDFGLAKLTEAAASGQATAGGALSMSPTITSPAMMTGVGVLLGTAAYMSPEQARGKTVDKRGDIWAFGAVLFEMLTGTRAFDGDDVSDTLAAILRGEPDWSLGPPRVMRLLRACLEKDRKRRLQSVADYQFLLDEVPVAAPAARPPLWWVIGTAVSLLAAVAIGIAYIRQMPVAEPTRRLSVATPGNATLGFVALSPDGIQLVISINTAGDSALWRRSLNSTQLQMLAGTANARAPFWSPDSHSLGFFAGAKLKTMPAGGGPAQVLCDSEYGRGGSWNRDGVILFGNGLSGSLDRVQSSGGPCTTLIKGDNTRTLTDPSFLPDGRHFLYLAISPDDAKAGLYVASLDDVPGRRLLPDQSSGIFASPRGGGTRGQLLFLREDRLMAQPFDAGKLQLAGEPVAVAAGGSFSLNRGQIAASLAADGTLLYLAAPPQRYQLTWLDRAGKATGKVGMPQNERHVAMSSDQKVVAAVRLDDQLVNTIWLHDLSRDVETRFASPAIAPVWSPDHRHIAYSFNFRDLYVRDIDGGQQDALVVNGNAKAPSDWSRDGRTLVYTETDPKTRADIWILSDPLGTGPKKPIPFVRSEFMESQGRLSPDGRWMAYTSDESGPFEIYVRPFPSGPGKWRISNNQGAEPSWRQDGKELFYVEPGAGRRRIVAVPVMGGADQRFEAGVPKPLFEFATTAIIPSYNEFVYGPASDGSRFLADVQVTDNATLNIITNWQQLVTNAPP